MAYRGLSNVKVILLEEQKWCYLTHWWEDKRVHTFPKGICPKFGLEFELAYYDSAVQHFNHYTKRTSTFFYVILFLILRGLYWIWLNIVWMRFLVFHCSIRCWYCFSSINQPEFLFLFDCFWLFVRHIFFSSSLMVVVRRIGNPCDFCFVGYFICFGGVVCVWVVDFMKYFPLVILGHQLVCVCKAGVLPLCKKVVGIFLLPQPTGLSLERRKRKKKEK